MDLARLESTYHAASLPVTPHVTMPQEKFKEAFRIRMNGLWIHGGSPWGYPQSIPM